MRIDTGRSLEVACAAQMAADWLERLNREGEDVELNAAALERLDTAGAQLLLSLEREVRARSGSLRIAAPNQELARVLGQLGLSLGAPGGAA